MGMVRNLAVAVVAKKLYDVARKPENQAKIKQLVGQLTDKAGSPARPAGTARR